MAEIRIKEGSLRIEVRDNGKTVCEMECPNVVLDAKTPVRVLKTNPKKTEFVAKVRGKDEPIDRT